MVPFQSVKVTTLADESYFEIITKIVSENYVVMTEK